MHRVRVDLDHSPYDILIERGLLGDISPILTQVKSNQVAIITNETVAPLYLAALENKLRNSGLQCLSVILPDGEEYKTWESLNTIMDALLAARFERKATLIALGGGVIGDMTGFAAAIYQRGVPFIQVPTTLLSQVDSSVGGKTAINHPLGKNMIGAFYQPRLVIADLDVLDTLPQRELAAGLAEVIKYGLIDDLPFFEWLEANMDGLVARDKSLLAQAVAWCCSNKARIVAEDEKENGVRALLNLGHTFGHAIEGGMGYGNWLHGEAVAAGMVMAARLSEQLGWINTDDVLRVESLIERAGLPIEPPRLGVETYMSWMASDKKVEGGAIRFVLMKALGRSIISPVPAEELACFLERSVA